MVERGTHNSLVGGSTPSTRTKRKGANMQGVTFTVYGKVRGQARPRFTGVGKKRRKTKRYAYEDAKAKEYKKAIAIAYREAANGAFFASGEVQMNIDVFRTMPEGYSGNIEPDVYRPDIDNIAKAVMDALNGVAYDDDKQVTRLTIIKEQREKQRKREHMRVYVGAVERVNDD